MSQRVVLCLLLLGCAPPVGQVGESAQPLIFGPDDRREVYDHEDAWLRDLARNSVVTLMRRPAMNATDPNNIRFGESYEVFNMCPEERFGGDPAGVTARARSSTTISSSPPATAWPRSAAPTPPSPSTTCAISQA